MIVLYYLLWAIESIVFLAVAVIIYMEFNNKTDYPCKAKIDKIVKLIQEKCKQCKQYPRKNIVAGLGVITIIITYLLIGVANHLIASYQINKTMDQYNKVVEKQLKNVGMSEEEVKKTASTNQRIGKRS